MAQPDPRTTLISAVLPEAWAGPGARAWVQVRRPIQVSLVAGCLTGLYTLTLPNLYKSEARILPADQRAGGGMGAAAAAAAMGVSIPGQESPDAVYVDILNSRSLREELLQSRFTFKVRTWYLGVEQTREQTLYEYLAKKNMDRAVIALKERIAITRDMKTKLITVSVETESPQLSQQATRSLVSLLNEFVVAKSRTKGGTKAEFSEKRLQEARVEMAQAEDAFRTFLDSNRNYVMSADPSIRLKGIRYDNELKLRTQLVTTLAIAREQALLEEKNDMPILNILDQGNLPIEKSGPSRAIIVAMVVAFVFIIGVITSDRERVRRFFVFG